MDFAFIAHAAETASHITAEIPSPSWLVSALFNTILIGGLGFFIKRWMDSQETALTKFCNENREEHVRIFASVESHTAKIAVLEDRTKEL